MSLNRKPHQRQTNAEQRVEPLSINSETQNRTRPFWYQLRWTLILSFVVVAVLPVFLAIAVTLSQARGQAGEQVVKQLESISELKRDQIRRWLDDSEQMLEMVFATDSPRNKRVTDFLATTSSGLEASDQPTQNGLNALLGASANVQSLFEEFFVYNNDGRIVVASNPVQIGKIVTGKPYFAVSLKGNFIQLPYYELGAEGGKLTMVITKPLVDELDGEIVGVLAGRLDMNTLGQIMTERTGLGESGETYLVSLENNYLLTPSRFEGYPLTRAYHSEAIDRVLRRENGSGNYDSYRDPPVPVLGVYQWIPELQAGLVAEVEEAEAFATFVQTRNFSLILGIVAVAIAVAIGWYYATRVSKPITALTQVATRIADGDLDQNVPVQTRNEIGVLAEAFNTMTGRLRELIDSLEDRIKVRTHALETSAGIGSQLIAMRNLDELLQYVVNRLQAEFSFYHTHIYLIEAETGDLIMVEGSGEVGRQLKEKGHQLAAGQGIVGTVASTNQAFLSNNVADLLNFVRNPLLPDTKSELAVPLRKGDEVLGVLDIQSEQADRFTPSDLSLMQAIANQTAIAIDNARLLAETQAALREVERLNLQLTGEAWEGFTKALPTVGYRYRGGISRPLMPDSNGWLLPMQQAAVSKQLVKEVHPGNGQPPRSELAVPLMLRGQVIGTLGIKRDEAADWSEDELTAVESVANQITLALENARLSEEQQKTIVQLKDVDRLKSEFLTSMSHELRTPLNSIIGFADVILQGIDGDIPEMAMNDVRLIHNSGQHLLALINDILDLSKIEAGKMELIREPLVISDMFKEVLSASSSLVKSKPVKIVIEADETLPPVYADKLRFNQIMLNLVSNAVKFTDEGTVTIKAEVQEHAPDQMFISVTDTGIGIPPDKIDAVFDRFRQADDSVTTRKYGGTGLGLPICKQLVEMHGGKLGLTSAEGKGSTFYFTVPLVVEPVALES